MPIDEEEIYQEHILDHYEDPFHRGHLPTATHAHEDNNPLCGDVVRIELELGDDGKIRDAYFSGNGCVISQASASMLLEKMQGKTVDEAKQFSAERHAQTLRPPPDPEPPEVLPALLEGAAVGGALAGRRQMNSPQRHGDYREDTKAHEVNSLRHLCSSCILSCLNLCELVIRDNDRITDRRHQSFSPPRCATTSRSSSKTSTAIIPLVFLDNAASTQRPRQVIDVLRRVYERDYANVHRGIHTLSERSTEQYEEAREKVRAFIGAETSLRNHLHLRHHRRHQSRRPQLGRRKRQSAATKSSSPRWSTTRIWCPGSNWPSAPARSSSTFRSPTMACLMLDALDSLLTDRTKIVAVASVSNVLGTINPVKEIARRAHAAGAVVLVDAAQSVPHFTTNVRDLGADFLAFSGHKMLGPTGIGVLYGREELLDAMPAVPRRRQHDQPRLARSLHARRAARQVRSRHAADRARHRPRRRDRLPQRSSASKKSHAHEHELCRYAYERLCSKSTACTSSARRPTTAPASSASRSTEPHPHDIAQLLDVQGIAVRAGHHCAWPLHDRLGIPASTRASFYLYNTPAEVDLLVEVVAKIRDRFRPQGRKRNAAPLSKLRTPRPPFRLARSRTFP